MKNQLKSNYQCRFCNKRINVGEHKCTMKKTKWKGSSRVPKSSREWRANANLVMLRKGIIIK